MWSEMEWANSVLSAANYIVLRHNGQWSPMACFAFGVRPFEEYARTCESALLR